MHPAKLRGILARCEERLSQYSVETVPVFSETVPLFGETVPVFGETVSLSDETV
jgi:hypothetical protein